MTQAVERKKEADEQLAEYQSRIATLQGEAKEMRDGERPGREQLAMLEGQLRAEEQRLDGEIREHDSRVATCMQDHSRLSEFARRLAEASSEQRQQLMADVERRHAQADRAVIEKRAP